MDLMLFMPNGLYCQGSGCTTNATPHYQYLRSVPPTQFDVNGFPIDGSFAYTDTSIVQPIESAATQAIFASNINPAMTYDWFHSIKLADVNGDGVADIVQCLDPSVGQGSGFNWQVYFWSANGGPGGGPGYAMSNAVTGPADWPNCAAAHASVHVADIDGDGKVDLLAPWFGAAAEHPCSAFRQ